MSVNAIIKCFNFKLATFGKDDIIRQYYIPILEDESCVLSFVFGEHKDDQEIPFRVTIGASPFVLAKSIFGSFDIKFVHQMQNAYSALTGGKELIYTSPNYWPYWIEKKSVPHAPGEEEPFQYFKIKQGTDLKKFDFPSNYALEKYWEQITEAEANVFLESGKYEVDRISENFSTLMFWRLKEVEI